MLRTLVILLASLCLSMANHNKIYVETNETVVVDDDGDGKNVVLPCRVVSPESLKSISLRLEWYLGPVRNATTVLYQQDFYFGYAWDRLRRLGDFDDPLRSYDLMIANVTEIDERLFCCDLRTFWRSGREGNGCSQLYYKLFNKDDVVIDCHNGWNETTDIPTSDAYPATISVKYHNIYPALDSEGQTRVFKVFDTAHQQVPLVSTQQFAFTSAANRYTAEVTFQWTEPGLTTFRASLAYEHANDDEFLFNCTFIQPTTTVVETTPPAAQTTTATAQTMPSSAQTMLSSAQTMPSSAQTMPSSAQTTADFGGVERQILDSSTALNIAIPVLVVGAVLVLAMAIAVWYKVRSSRVHAHDTVELMKHTDGKLAWT